MSEMRDLLLETASRVFTDLCTRDVREGAEKNVWPRELWRALEDTGLAMASTSEARGGAGADLADVCALVRLAGAAAIPVPLAETLLAEEVLARAGLPVHEGPLTIAPVLRCDQLTLAKGAKGWTLSGTANRVPWGSKARAAVVVARFHGEYRTAVTKAPPVSTRGWSYAKEPRDTLRFDDVVLPNEAVSDTQGFSFDEMHFRGALYRAAAMAGALERTLELTVQYAKDRIQFGRAIGKFQAVQQQIAVLATQVAAASAAAHAAVDIASTSAAQFEIAAAKARIGEAAGIAIGISHQVHAAIGFSHEYPLHLRTRRLLSWRDEFGTESEWAAWVGRAATRVGGENLWTYVTDTRKEAV